MKKPAVSKPGVKKAGFKASSGYGPSTGAKAAGGAKSSAADKAKITELNNEMAEMKMTADTLEKERDFYFGKLRDIEILLQNQPEPAPISDLVMKILYATEDEKVEIDESGNLTIHGEGEEG